MESAEAGAFNQIDWSLGDYHMGIEINTGDGFIDMGTTQLMSVPFALYALNSGTTNSASLPQGTNDGDVLRWNSATNSWTVEDVSVNLSPVYLAENGITVKAKDWAGIGAKGMLNGVEYTVVDRGMLRDMYEYDSDRSRRYDNCLYNKINKLRNDGNFILRRLQPGHQRLGCEQCDKYEFYVSRCTKLQPRLERLGCEQCDRYELYV